MGIDELLFGDTMGWSAGQPRGWREDTCAMCPHPMTCQQRGYCAQQIGMSQFQSQAFNNAYSAHAPTPNAAREGYDVDLPAHAVREVRAVPLLGLDVGRGEHQAVCAARVHADGSIEIIGICEYTGEADSDGGECD
ncbi:hypothetical protein [Burkholderia cepacia]|uniref:hypothetical protein n=1 Tax=Burkholderia cepacia TaxID=292 RepID=UPI001CF10305|nr:hypothetical protein [Burkholderia cepacia]MCA8326110.1 hypothetical protein [Burkholderia cepacia]